MGEEVTYSPEQWVEHYQGDYLKTMTIETAGRIIKSDMTNVARSCVSVGFHLKAIRDRELFRDAGYDTLWDYAADQFGISKWIQHDVYDRYPDNVTSLVEFLKEIQKNGKE